MKKLLFLVLLLSTLYSLQSQTIVDPENFTEKTTLGGNDLWLFSKRGGTGTWSKVEEATLRAYIIDGLEDSVTVSIIQDSIVLLYWNGTEISRDTLGAVGGGSAAWASITGKPAGFADDTDDVDDADADPNNEKDLTDHTGTLTTTQLGNDIVTNDKLAHGTANTLRGFDGSGVPAEVTAGTNITITGNTISATGGISGLTDDYVPMSNATGDGLEDSPIFIQPNEVGINNTAPITALHVGSSSSDGDYVKVHGSPTGLNRDAFVGELKWPRIRLIDNSTGGSIFTYWNIANTMRFGTDVGGSGSSAFFVKSGSMGDVVFNGNLGVGVSNPLAKLDVDGDIRTSTQIEFGGTTPYIGLSGLDLVAYTLGGSVIKLNAEAGSSEIYVEDGEVGIGTETPVNRLDVEGGAAIGSSYSGTSVAPTDGLIVEGNVGIGTTSPTNDLLHIEGAGAYELLRSTNASLSTRITFENEADDNDSWQIRRNETGTFTIGHSADQPYNTESIVLVMSPEEFRTYTNSILIENISAATASGLSVNNGRIVYVNTTDATFTSVGFWGVVGGTWTKL